MLASCPFLQELEHTKFWDMNFNQYALKKTNSIRCEPFPSVPLPLRAKYHMIFFFCCCTDICIRTPACELLQYEHSSGSTGSVTHIFFSCRSIDISIMFFNPDICFPVHFQQFRRKPLKRWNRQILPQFVCVGRLSYARASLPIRKK